MTTSAIIISIIFIICLTAPVATRSVGLITPADKPSRTWLIPLMFGVNQGLAMMLVVAIKMFVDSIRILKGKLLYTISNDTQLALLCIISAMNTLLMSLMGPYFMPFGNLFIAAVTLAGFLWSLLIIRREFTPGTIKKLSFIEFSASVFMLIIAILYLFTDLI